MAAIIAPSILTADFGNLREEVQSVVAGGCKLLHLDVMDGHFVPNITFGPSMVKMLRSAVDIPFDVHLMIEEPEKYIEEFYQAGANIPGSIICVHYEACPHVHRTIEKIHRLGAEVLADHECRSRIWRSGCDSCLSAQGCRGTRNGKTS